MNFLNIFPVALGGVVGAVLRWILGLLLPAAPILGWGTLAANWIGALLIGFCAEWVADPQWRLLLITGFLGSLTTLSSFSLETVTMMQEGRWMAAALSVCLHVGGSFILTAAGIWLAHCLK